MHHCHCSLVGCSFFTPTESSGSDADPESESSNSDGGEQPERQERGRPRGRGGARRARGRARGGRPRGEVDGRSPDTRYGWVDVDDDYEEPPAYSKHQEVKTGKPANEPVTEIEAFGLIFDADFFRLVKSETNRYARQSMNEQQRRLWKAVTLEELNRFFAVIVHMSLVRKPHLKDYFSTHPVMWCPFPYNIGMGRDRFLSILKYLHISDNTTYLPRNDPNHDAAHKIRPLLDHLNRKFKELYTPSEHLTLDEAIVPFRGRIRFKVYMKNKPNKYGIRLEVVCDASNGIVLHFEAYTGADSNIDNTVKELVNRLLEPFEGNNYKIFMDRRYSSPDLFVQLLEKGFYPVGTVMKNRRNMPKRFKVVRLKRGEFVNRRKGKLLATRWKDKRDVFMLSTIHKAVMVDTEQEARGDHQTIKPASVIDYNKYKAGVDSHDQMASYYPLNRKTLKWWKKMFFHLFNMGIINSLKYMNIHNKTSVRLDEYMRVLARKLAGPDPQDTYPPAGAMEPRRHREGDHFPVRLPPTEKKAKPTRCCVLCNKKRDEAGNKIRRETSYKCRECDLPLCVECFLPYHRPLTANVE